MKTAALVALMLSALAVIPVAAQKPTVMDPLTDQEVDNAIVMGRADRLEKVSASCLAEKPRSALASGSFGLLSLPFALHEDAVNKDTVFTIDLMSAPGLIARAAWEATQAGEAFSRADVPTVWRMPAIYVHIVPKLADPEGTKAIIPRATVMKVSVITSSPLYRPITLTTEGELEVLPRVWRNASGATVQYAELRTHFVAKEIMILPRNDGFAPTSTTHEGQEGTQIFLDTNLGERSCRLDTARIQNLLKR